MAYTRQAKSSLKANEAERLKTKKLELQTSLQRIESWDGSDEVRELLCDAIHCLGEVIRQLETEAAVERELTRVMLEGRDQ